MPLSERPAIVVLACIAVALIVAASFWIVLSDPHTWQAATTRIPQATAVFILTDEARTPSPPYRIKHSGTPTYEANP